MTLSTPGMHHVTAISGDAQANYDFYAGLLGLRLVKRTVNFDDPATYHLYYGDGAGSPGTILTFFPWGSQGRKGHPGTGQTTAIALAVPIHSLAYWQDRLREHGVEADRPKERFGEQFITLADPDGIRIELVASGETLEDYAWDGANVPAEHAIRGVHHLEFLPRQPEETVALLTVMGFMPTGEEGRRVRLASSGAVAALVDVVTPTDNDGRGRMGAGAIHHAAWRAADDEEQLAWREQLVEQGFQVTDVRDRQYFHSIYFREPGGILFEIATDVPGFLVDEAQDTLGTALKLPPWYESERDRIEAVLPPLHAGQSTTNV